MITHLQQNLKIYKGKVNLLKGETDKYIIRVGGIPQPVLHQRDIKKISKDTEFLNNIISNSSLQPLNTATNNYKIHNVHKI